MQRFKQLRLVLLTLAFLAVAGYWLYQRYYPPFSADEKLVVEAQSCTIPSIYWPERRMKVSIAFNTESPVDVYVLRSDGRSEDEVVKAEGKEALEHGKTPANLLGSQQNATSGKIVFDKPERMFFDVLVVNRSKQASEVKIELYGR